MQFSWTSGLSSGVTDAKASWGGSGMADGEVNLIGIEHILITLKPNLRKERKKTLWGGNVSFKDRGSKAVIGGGEMA